MSLLACIAVVACGDSVTGGGTVPGNASGNWYLYDPSAPPVPGQFSQIGAALAVHDGVVTGNAMVAISSDSGQCSSYGQDLPLTGTLDGHGNLAVRATDNVDTLSLSATLAANDMSFANGAYRASGQEAYPQDAPAQLPCTTPSGKLNGTLMQPVNAIYGGTLNSSTGPVQVRLTLHQDTIPVEGGWSNPHDARSAIILRGHIAFLVGGFFVTGTMQLTPSVCGVSTATIQPKVGYVWGTVLQIEFDTDTTYRHGAWFANFIDPKTGAITVANDTVYSDSASSLCTAYLGAGTLTRQ